MLGHNLALVLMTSLWSIAPAMANLYPTKPISTTIYQAGLPALVQWIDDGSDPLLNRTGEVRIDLYEGNNTYLATLAKGVDPEALSTTIFIPPSVIPKNYHSFTLRFLTVEPVQIIYSADFAIIQNSFSSVTLSTTATSSCHATVTTTVISSVMSTQVALPSAVRKESAAAAAGRWGQRTLPSGLFSIDSDRMRFRLMFIVWPALMGLSMAI